MAGQALGKQSWQKQIAGKTPAEIKEMMSQKIYRRWRPEGKVIPKGVEGDSLTK